MSITTRIAATLDALRALIASPEHSSDDVIPFFGECGSAFYNCLPTSDADGGRVELDTHAIRDLFRDLLDGRSFDGDLRASAVSFANDYVEEGGSIPATRDGNYTPIAYLAGLVAALCAETFEAWAAEDERARADLDAADAFWTAVANGASHTTARDLAS